MEAKRVLIQKIRADSSLSETEKSLKIQELMMGNYSSSIHESLNKSNESKTCSHYTKYCYKFYFDCCKVYDPCQRCHLERKCNTKRKDHNFENLVVSEITCSVCEHKQAPGESCTNCQIKFSNSFCGICQIWTDIKDITHCHKCGVCRVGKPEDLVHVDKYGQCFSVNSAKAKEQLNANTNQNKEILVCKNNICGICYESTFYSQKCVTYFNCGHYLHSDCLNKYIGEGGYKCIECKKSISNLTNLWNTIRSVIKSNPIPEGFFPIRPGNIIGSKFGKFLVSSIIDITNEDSNIEENTYTNSEENTDENIDTNTEEITEENKLYFGEFVDWNLQDSIGNKKKAFGSLNFSTIKNVLYKNIHCNDCETNSITKFHFEGLECINCGSFNTQE